MKIAILSKGRNNYTTKRLKEVAEARGHDVRVINYAKCYMTMERGNPVVYYGGGALEKLTRQLGSAVRSASTPALVTPL